MNKVVTTSNYVETVAGTAKWNEKWSSRLSMVVSYPCTGVVAVSFALSVVCRNIWLTLPGVAMILYGVIYLSFICDRTSAAWRNWVSRHRKSSDLPRGLWRIHSKIHDVFIRHQKAFLRGTFALSTISYIGAFIFCEWTYPGITDLREINPAAAMLRMILWSVIAAILSLWISYIITHQKWAKDDAWGKLEQEMHNLAESNLK